MLKEIVNCSKHYFSTAGFQRGVKGIVFSPSIMSLALEGETDANKLRISRVRFVQRAKGPEAHSFGISCVFEFE